MITGAGRGHAEAIARLFAKEGAVLSICDIIPLKELERTVGSAIRAEGGQVLCFQTDVSKEDQVNKMVQKTLKENPDVRWTFVFTHKPFWEGKDNPSDSGWAAVTGLLQGTPVVAGGGDQAANGVGVGAVSPGVAPFSLR